MTPPDPHTGTTAHTPGPDIMGSAEDAKAALIDLTRKWRALRQPLIATAKEHRAREIAEREVRFQLANAALLWLWHEEAALRLAQGDGGSNE